jgi:hypothetical protein
LVLNTIKSCLGTRQEPAVEAVASSPSTHVAVVAAAGVAVVIVAGAGAATADEVLIVGEEATADEGSTAGEEAATAADTGDEVVAAAEDRRAKSRSMGKFSSSD